MSNLDWIGFWTLVAVAGLLHMWLMWMENQ